MLGSGPLLCQLDCQLLKEHVMVRLARLQVRTFDCGAQVEGPHWTLHQWALYWEARRPLNKVRGSARRSGGPGGCVVPTWCRMAVPAWLLQRLTCCALLLLPQEVFVMPQPPRHAQPAEDEADSAAVTRKRTAADSDITGQALKGITFDCKKRLLAVPQLAVAGTPLEVRGKGVLRGGSALTQLEWEQGLVLENRVVNWSFTGSKQ